MGKPKFSRKKYETPSHPWQEDRIKAENELVKKYGLKNKREIWKAETTLRKYRGQARGLLAKISGADPQTKKESDQLLLSLNRLNILKPNASLDDVLALDTESVLSRRLQTLTYLKGLANTPLHARQIISHGHISIDGRKVTVPGYIVTKDEEGEIEYVSNSPLTDTMHPARPRADFKSPLPPRTEKKPEPAEEKKEKPEKPKEEAKETETKDKAEDKKEESEKPKEEQPKTEKSDEKKPEPVEETKEEPKREEKPVEKSPREEPSKPEKQEEKPKEEPVQEKTESEDKSKNKEEGGN